MEKIKVGLVGIGGMGGCHFQNYDNVKNAQVVAVCDIREGIAKEKTEGRNINLYTDIDKMLSTEKLDVVDICTPSYLHAEMAVKCLNKGLNVLCEKPMTLTYEDAQKVLEASNKSNKKFMVAHVVRFMAPYKYLANVIKSNELGKLLRLEMKRISSVPGWSWEDWMRKPELSGGVLTDLSIHDLDFVQSLFGNPKKISSYHRDLKDNSEYIVTSLVYDDLLVTCEGTWYKTDIPFEASFLAVFENGYVEYNKSKLNKNGEEITRISESAKNKKDLGINISNDNGYLSEIQYFVNCVEKDKKIKLVTPKSSANSIKLLEKIKKVKKEI